MIRGALVALLVAATLAAPAGGGSRAPARVQVVAKEFELGPSRYTLRAGQAIVELVNFGEDEHDLALRRNAAGARTIYVKSTLPGSVRRVQTNLAPGSYVLWCTLGDHRALGMQTRLSVLRPTPIRHSR